MHSRETCQIVMIGIRPAISPAVHQSKHSANYEPVPLTSALKPQDTSAGAGRSHKGH